MKAYKKRLTLETVLLLALSVLLIAVQVLAFRQVIRPLSGEHWPDFWNGLIAGASFGLMALFLIGAVINLRALTSEERLKKLYTKENDERTAEIIRRAQSMGMRISVPLMLATGMVLGYFDMGMSIVCLACAVLQSIITVLAKVYWRRSL